MPELFDSEFTCSFQELIVPTSLEQLLEMLRKVPTGQLHLMGYVGADGDYHALTAADLAATPATTPRPTQV